ncbi:aldose epimerase family protein [Luteolibacter sp. AS25]|uniref:aldose epimerase family protein n=1 Tax=Luteolibacter sp. AS25 TaxID=3135776 RepID=UPI00398B8E7C
MPSAASISKTDFGVHKGSEVSLYRLSNASGLEVDITDFGGAVVAIRTPDRDGRSGDVILGFDDLSGYEDDLFYLGAITGRHANRISGGRFELDGEVFRVTVNNGPNHLHGGKTGFNKKVWAAEYGVVDGDPQLRLQYVSVDGEEGFPGNLKACVIYNLTSENELRIDYEATTDRKTVCNLSDHIYWNLSGSAEDNVLEHELMLFSDKFTPLNDTAVPTGEIRKVEGSAFDFRKPKKIGAGIESEDEQIVLAEGYDHNFIVRGEVGCLRPAARAHDPESGRVLEVFTTDPGVQFYTGNFLDESVIGKCGKPYGRRRGFCLESQYFPDSVNRPEFLAAILRPGEKYKKTTVYRFSAK